MTITRSEKTNYYEVMKISRDAPFEVIRAVYRAWMFALKLHPDLGGDTEAARALNEAYEVLSNESLRAKYDEGLGENNRESRSFENRKSPRFRVEADVMCLFEGESSWIKARVVDASVTGIRVISQFVADKNSRVLIAFPCKASNAVDAKIAWLAKKGRSVEFGMEFFEPLHDVLKRLGCKRSG